MQSIQPSLELKVVISFFHQDVLLDFPPEQILPAAIQQLTPVQQRRLRAFLDEVLRRRHTGGDLKRLWNDAGSDFYLQQPEKFFHELRDRLPSG